MAGRGVGPLYDAIGTRLFDTIRDEPLSAAGQGSRELLEPLLRDIRLPGDLADALDDAAFDDVIRAETEEALTLTGRDVGTPILHFKPPGGMALFGPVISRLPDRDGCSETVGPRHRARRASLASRRSSAACASVLN